PLTRTSPSTSNPISSPPRSSPTPTTKLPRTKPQNDSQPPQDVFSPHPRHLRPRRGCHLPFHRGCNDRGHFEPPHCRAGQGDRDSRACCRLHGWRTSLEATTECLPD